MAESTVTSKGQTTVPADVRASMGAVPGTKLVWNLMSDGRVLVRAKNRSILDMVGMLKPAEGKHVSIEEMNPWR